MQVPALTKQNGSSFLLSLKLYVRNRSDKAKPLLTGLAHLPAFRAGREAVGPGCLALIGVPTEKGQQPKAAGPANSGRCERIRTFDPLHPMQVRYQAAPHTDKLSIIA